MNLNPFDMHGPDFLVFYVMLSVITIFIVWIMRRRMEAGQIGEEEELGKKIAKDPYHIAYLHGGRLEVLRVATVSLLERGLLNADGENLLTQDANAAAKARRPLDKSILTKYVEAGRGQEICTDPIIQSEADAVGVPLKEMKLIPDVGTNCSRAMLFFVAAGFLDLIAGIKIYVALSRGHTNIFFLIALAVIAPIILCLVTFRRRTSLGDRTYAYLQNFFGSLKDRRESFDLSRTTSELTFLAAVFGIAALPDAFAGTVKSLKIHPPGQSGAASGGCGSSCGGGGGGGCGGGGCGGGCGGCG
jgi:uncharacterized protein (TIGR04222 family)